MKFDVSELKEELQGQFAKVQESVGYEMDKRMVRQLHGDNSQVEEQMVEVIKSYNLKALGTQRAVRAAYRIVTGQELPSSLAAQQAQAQQQAARPGLADVFYGKGAVEFGQKARSMADVSDFQGRKEQARQSLELALEGDGGENRAQDAYTRLMALAEENPAATIDELMKIIGRG